MKVEKLGIMGAGNMGSGIAQKAAQEGLTVVMVDTEERFVQKGMDSIAATLDEGVERKLFTPEQKAQILGRITGTTDREQIKDADLVIEVIFEDRDVKKKLFGELDELCDPTTMFASNTSSFSITDLAQAVERKDRFLGLHFFYHPAKNRLLEVIPGEGTAPEVLEAGSAFSARIGKTGIVVKDAPGFAVNRFFVPWLNEATRLLEEGVADIPTIDEAAMKAFGIGMGPFKLMNVTGPPIAYHSTCGLGEKLGDFYGPSECLKKQFESEELWDLEGEPDMSKAAAVEERLLGAVFTVACTLVEEDVASVEDTDRGAKVGLRWAMGPFEMMNETGIQRAGDIVKAFVEMHDGLQMPLIMSAQVEKGGPWTFSFVDLDIQGELARITINRPEAMNAINETVVEQLGQRFDKAQADPAVKAIVIEGAGKAFIAGADIQYFVDKIKADKIGDIVTFTKGGHDLLKKIDNSDKLVIAKLDGLALGGGMEIALAADTIVATEKGTVGFPETGIGIYPGLGGTQRTTRYIGRELTKYLVLTGKTLGAIKAKDIGLIEYVVPTADVDEKIAELASSSEVITKSNKGEVRLSKEDIALKGYFSNDNLEALLTGGEGQDEKGQKLARTISFKAPIAVKLANRLIDEGGAAELEQGLQMELDNLPEIFSTADALEGLTSVLERRRPTYKGE